MSSSTATAREILAALFGPALGDQIAVRLWDGSQIGNGRASFTIVVAEPGALRAAFQVPVELSAGRAFAAGALDCEGDLEAGVDALLQAAASLDRKSAFRLWNLLRRLPRPQRTEVREARLRGALHSRGRDLAAIGFHYDQPLSFYKAFLDPRLVYSCAYFDEGVQTLEAAQLAKLDHILRKLRLRAGETFLDIGCGWGALVIRAAERFGARALGITLSRSQHDEANRRIAAAGLEERVRVELLDYRDLGNAHFDKIASVGMFEHVGRSRLAEYFACAYRALRPGGLFLNHGIAAETTPKGRQAPTFVERFVFPDGELVRIADALRFAENAGFEVRDVENLREHYTRTLRAWVANLEHNRDAAVAAAGEQSYRIWRLYMAGSAQGFRTRRIAVYQTLLARPHEDGSVEIPATRRDLYA